MTVDGARLQNIGGEFYNLVIRVASTDQNSEKIVVTPTLEGGGTELP